MLEGSGRYTAIMTRVCLLRYCHHLITPVYGFKAPHSQPNMQSEAPVMFVDVYTHINNWLVVSIPLKNISHAIGMIIPNIWKDKKMFQTNNQITDFALRLRSKGSCDGASQRLDPWKLEDL